LGSCFRISDIQLHGDFLFTKIVREVTLK
jgi:hypothetical protein